VSFAVVLAIGIPALAQAPTTPYSPSSSQPPPYTPSPPSASQAAPYGQQSAPYTQQPAPYAQQAPAQSSAGSAVTTAPYSASESATEPMSTEPMSRRHVMRRLHHGRSVAHMLQMRPRARRGAPSDNVADQLNREELGRVSSGSSTGSPGYQPPANAPQGQPPSAAGHY
jgi:hypothetical protein